MKVKGGGKRRAGVPAENPAQNGVDDEEYYGEKVGEASDAGDNYQSLGVDNPENQDETGEQEKEEESEDDGGNEQEEAAQDEGPKLADGFFEIESVRRRRVRKGKLQYLIKWRGWPDTANTWEPLENLQSISDVIEAFDESLRSGKSSRKRKRKSGGPQSLPKKRQPRSTNVTDVAGPSNPLAFPNLTDFHANIESTSSGQNGENNVFAEYGLLNGPKQISTGNEETEYDPKLSELKGAIPTNDVNTDGKLKEAWASEPRLPNNENVEAAQSDRRVGARRRKSGSVKRFKQDSAAAKLAVSRGPSPSIPFGYAAGEGPLEIGNFNGRNVNEDSRNVPTIVKILKPIDFAASGNDDSQDVVVTFKALRSDGKEVLVDNKSLKANDPLLLINFYEQHLKYSTP